VTVHRSPRNTYKKVADDLRRRIQAGEFPKKLPTRREVAAFYGISQSTADRAVNTLRDEGLIACIRGSGSYRSGPNARPLIDRLTDLLRTGERNVGDQFPPELTLCEQFEVARNTLRSAIAKMEGQGLIGRRGPRRAGRVILTLPPDKEDE
jgi:DNA-binding GntR family transcriptional regulator